MWTYFSSNCIKKWIIGSKNCPACRTKALESDIIKLFIEENMDNNDVAETQIDESYIEIRYPDYWHRKMNKCKCELLQCMKNIGDLEYRYLEDFKINIRSYKRWTDGRITEILLDGYLITIFQSTKLEILRQKTNEKSIVTPDGKRYEYFNVPNSSQHDIKIIFNSKQGIHRFANGIQEPLTEPNIVRSNVDSVKQDENYIKFCFLGFCVKRNLKKGKNGKVVIHHFTENPNKSLKITICPEHQIFHVDHFLGNKIIRCTNSGILCEHLQN
uniref:Uncharacterized protein n=1 Tax=Panagrolaimus davidi TaxID=227884 RepID=A0A914P7Q7_9BILA